MIVVGRERLCRAPLRGEPPEIRLRPLDDGDVYTSFGADNALDAVTARVVFGAEAGTVPDVGDRQDKVRLVVTLPPEGRESGDASVGQAFPARVTGYIRRGDIWAEDEVMLTPSRDELYERNRGIVETDVVADKKVLIAGLGSIGSEIAPDLTKSGVGHLVLVDNGRLEPGNVSRHALGVSDIGRYKVLAVADAIRDRNPYAQVETYTTKIEWRTRGLVEDLVSRVDLVISALDDKQGRVDLNMVCLKQRKPLIVTGTFTRACGGQVLRIRPWETPCYGCFLRLLPAKARIQEMPSREEAARAAYSNGPVAVEPGLAIDIQPVTTLAEKMAVQELMRGKQTTLRSLDEDLIAPWYLWLNRREVGTQYEHLEPLGFGLDGFRILRWYGVRFERDPQCPDCGDFTGHLARREGLEVTDAQTAEFLGQEGA